MRASGRNPRRIEPFASGVLVVAASLHTRRDLSAHAISSGKTWVSRYAWGRIITRSFGPA